MKDQYEKQISILEAENKELKVEVEEQKPVIKDLEGQVKHWKA
jgi:predicted RNase H-like nuclease (RuvC/YqgF family)